MEENNSEKYSKQFLKFENGYVLELTDKLKENKSGEGKLIFSVFYNEFKGYPLLQELREYLIVRKDKERDKVVPYILNIEERGKLKQLLSVKCLEELVKITDKDAVKEAKITGDVDDFKNQKVQDYFYKELHCYIENPTFDNIINLTTEQIKKEIRFFLQ